MNTASIPAFMDYHPMLEGKYIHFPTFLDWVKINLGNANVKTEFENIVQGWENDENMRGLRSAAKAVYRWLPRFQNVPFQPRYTTDSPFYFDMVRDGPLVNQDHLELGLGFYADGVRNDAKYGIGLHNPEGLTAYVERIKGYIETFINNDESARATHRAILWLGPYLDIEAMP